MPYIVLHWLKWLVKKMLLMTVLDEASALMEEPQNWWCCLYQVISLQDDSENEKPEIQHYLEGRGHLCMFYLKFHCKINPIEMLRGYMKYCELPCLTDIISADHLSFDSISHCLWWQICNSQSLGPTVPQYGRMAEIVEGIKLQELHQKACTTYWYTVMTHSNNIYPPLYRRGVLMSMEQILMDPLPPKKRRYAHFSQWTLFYIFYTLMGLYSTTFHVTTKLFPWGVVFV